jgi:hypothetical protein
MGNIRTSLPIAKAQGVRKLRTQIPNRSQRTVVGDSVLDNHARPRITDGNA